MRNFTRNMPATANIILFFVLLCFPCFASNSKVNLLGNMEAGMISQHLEYCRKCDEELKYLEVLPSAEATPLENRNEGNLNFTPKKDPPVLCVIYRKNRKEPIILAFENMQMYSLFFLENNISRCCGLPYFKTVVDDDKTKADVQHEVKTNAKRCKRNPKRKCEDNEDAKTMCSSHVSDSEAYPITLHRHVSSLGPTATQEATNENKIVRKIKGVVYDSRRKLPYRVKIWHKWQIVFEGAFKTQEEAEEAAKREYIKLKKDPVRAMTTKKKHQMKNQVFPKSNVKGVQFLKSNREFPWIYTFKNNRKLIQKSFRMQEEAEEAAFAHHKMIRSKQGVSDVRGVYLSKNKILKQPWEVRVMSKNKLVFNKRYKTKEEAEETSKLEHGLREIRWNRKQVHQSYSIASHEVANCIKTIKSNKFS